MHTTQSVQSVHCLNCGSLAKRHYFAEHKSKHDAKEPSQLIQTECNACDYLIITCAISGRVIEAYAPGIPVHQFFSPRLNLETPEISLRRSPFRSALAS